MADTPLRSLAKAYSKKTLELDAYRDARAKFINGVIAGELELPVNNYPPLIRPDDETSMEETVRRDKKKTITEQSRAAEVPVTSNRTLITAIITVVVLVSVIGIYFIVREPDNSTGTASSTQTASIDVNQARTLINDFLDQKNWSTGNLDSFLQNWNMLPAEVRTGALELIEISQLTNAIYKQLLQERALSGIRDSGGSNEKQKILVDFARSIGITDERIVVKD